MSLKTVVRFMQYLSLLLVLRSYGSINKIRQVHIISKAIFLQYCAHHSAQMLLSEVFFDSK